MPMIKRHFLDFEQPVAELEAKIEELRYVQNESAVDISEEIDRLSKKSLLLTKDIYSGLTPWQVTQIARHPQRPYTLDYVGEVFTDFQELHGDRAFADDQSIVGGLARFNGQACVVFGHQKGRDTKERAARNFGMSLTWRKASLRARFRNAAICLVSRCAPPTGSLTILSTRPSAFSRCAVMPSCSAASDARSAVFHRIEAQPSGEITE